MVSRQDKEIAAWALDECKKQGAAAARVGIHGGAGSSYELRDLTIDKIQRSSERSMVIQLFVDGRYGSYSTNRINKTELTGFIKKGIDNTRYLAEDPFRTLANPSRYYKGKEFDLGLYDATFNDIDPQEKIELARRIGEEMHEKDPRILSHSEAYGDSLSFSYIADSQGFEGESFSTHFTISASASVKDEQSDARPENYWFDYTLFYDALKKQDIGKIALERTLAKLGTRKVASGEYPMLVDNLNARQLLSPIISAARGMALQQRNSFLIDKLGQQLFAPSMNLTDNPCNKSTPGSRLFDSEGVATQKRAVIEDGYLRTYFIDTYIANKMSIEPTISDVSVLHLNQGEKSLNELVKSMNKGILVTGFNGGNCNSSTGDFSYGIEGFLIENGEKTHPVSEMNITGNIITLWQMLAETGNDPNTTSSWRLPSLLFEKVAFSGL